MRILIVKISAMGDVLHALPVLDYLHRACPGCRVDWVVEEAFADLLRNNPLIDRLLTVNFKKWKRAPFASRTRQELREAAARLADGCYDLVLDIQGNIKSGIVARLTGCTQRLGFARPFTQESLNVLFSTRRIAPLATDRHITDQYLRVASAPFGGQFDALQLGTSVATAAADDAAAAELVAGCAGRGPLFLFHTGTTWQTKFWHEDGWIALGRQLQARYPRAVMLFTWGSEAERQAAGRIAAALGGCARVLERLPLMRVAALIKQVDLVVGGDTGIVHLAAAVGTPTVSYYRSSDGLRSGPRGSRHAVLQAPMPCARCFKTRCDKDRECRESITARMLAAAVTDVMNRNGVDSNEA